MRAVSTEPEVEPIDPPIHSLPPEILSEIFLLAIGNLYDIFRPLCMGPWLLVRVCRRWRDVAWGHSALWSSFMVRWPRQEQEDTGARLLKETLQRTGHNRLFMVIWIREPFPDVIIETLVQHSSQWGTVHLIEHPSTQWARLSERNTHFPSLKSLIVDYPSSADLAIILGMFKDAPNLRSLYLDLNDTPLADFDPEAIPFPWSHITDLNMPIMCRVELSVKILRLCSNLETLEESCDIRHFEIGTEKPSPLMVQKFRSLDVSSSQLLPYIICPALEHLSLAILDGIPFSTKDLSQFHVHSGSQLQSLQIGLLKQDIADPGQLFLCMPQLRKLVLNNRSWDNSHENMAKILTSIYSQDLGLVLPRLSVLEVYANAIFTGISERCDEALVGIIDQRWNVPRESRVTQLHQVRIYCKSDVMRFTEYAPTLSRIERLKSFKMEGLDISISGKWRSSSSFLYLVIIAENLYSGYKWTVRGSCFSVIPLLT